MKEGYRVERMFWPLVFVFHDGGQGHMTVTYENTKQVRVEENGELLLSRRLFAHQSVSRTNAFRWVERALLTKQTVQ